jgi:3-oxoacyl-[acyl-carrier protein] reductase
MKKIKSEFILVTGSGRGLGRELAVVFASYGYNIILHDRNKKDLQKAKEEILKSGVDCVAVSGDLNDPRTLDKLYKTVNNKNISILINNAGVHCPGLAFEEISDKQIEDILFTNFIAPVKITKKIYSVFLKKGKGTVININSISGLENQRLRTIYCASKWGLRGFSETLKKESSEKNIRIIDVYPSRIKTRAEFTVGMEPKYVAQKIYEAYEKQKIDKVLLDDRPKNKK